MEFNNIDFSEYFVVENINRPILPPVDPVTVKVPGRHGSHFVRTEIDNLTLPIVIRFIEDSRKELNETIREVAGLLRTKEPKKLVLRDEPDKYNMAILTGTTDIDRMKNTGSGMLVFTCPDPYLYSSTTKTITAIHDKTITNKGSEPTYGMITGIAEQGANYAKFTLTNTGEYVHIDGVTGGDILTIDLESGRAFKNGVPVESHLESDFFLLPPGDFKITTYGVLSADLEFRERWL